MSTRFVAMGSEFYLLSVDNVDQIISYFSHVAGAEPTIHKGVFLCFQVIMISFGNDRALNKNFSTLSRFDVLAIVVDNSKKIKISPEG
jgi:hypothetical protein